MRVILPKGFRWESDRSKIPPNFESGQMAVYFAEFSHNMLKLGISAKLKRRMTTLEEQVRPARWEFISVAWLVLQDGDARELERTMKTRWSHIRQPKTEWLKNAGFSTILGSAASHLRIAMNKDPEV